MPLCCSLFSSVWQKPVTPQNKSFPAAFSMHVLTNSSSLYEIHSNANVVFGPRVSQLLLFEKNLTVNELINMHTGNLIIIRFLELLDH